MVFDLIVKNRFGYSSWIAIGFNINGDLFCYFVSNYRWDINMKILRHYPELCGRQQHAALHFQDSRHFHVAAYVVERKYSFYLYGVGAVLFYIHIAGEGAREGRLWIFVALDIILIKMFLHQLFGEDKSLQKQTKRQVLFFDFDKRIDLVILCLNVFHVRHGIKTEESGPCEVLLAKGKI